MSKLKKIVLIERLSKLGIEYDISMSYNDLYKLYKVVNWNGSKLNDSYTYIPGEGEELLMDIPSIPIERLI